MCCSKLLRVQLLGVRKWGFKDFNKAKQFNVLKPSKAFCPLFIVGGKCMGGLNLLNLAVLLLI